MENILAKKLKDVENKKILFNTLLIISFFIVFSNSVSALENLGFEDSEAFTCPISDWDIVLGSCITNISDCADWGRKIFVSNESYTNTLAYSTCDNYDFDSDVRSHWFTIPNNLSYIEASIYGFYGISEKTAIVDLIYQNGSVIAEDDRYVSGYRKNEWVKANITLPAGLGGITARLRIRHGTCVAQPCRLSVDNITFYTSDDTAMNMSDLEDEYPSSQFYGFVNELDGTTPIEDATLYFCRVSGATNFCPTCDSVNVTRCLSQDYTTTDANGYFNKTLINGIYEIWINKAYYGKTYIEETIVVGQTQNYSLANYTTNHTFIDGENGGALADVYEYCYDTEFLTSNDDDDNSDASGNSYTQFYLPPEELVCSFTKSGFQGGEFTFDYDYTCSETLDSSVMTCEYKYIAMAVYNENLDDSTVHMYAIDDYTNEPIEDAVITLFESDSEATKTGVVLDVQTTDATGLVSFIRDENTYYYISIGASGYIPYTVGNAAVGNFPLAGGITVQRFYLTNASLQKLDLLVNISRDETAYMGFFDITCTSTNYGNFSGSYNANGSGQVFIEDSIPPYSSCVLTSVLEGLDYAYCPDLGGVCSIYMTEDTSINVSILHLIENKINILEANTYASLFGEGAFITVYNCSNNTYLDCDVYAQRLDNILNTRPTVSVLNGSFIKVQADLTGHFQTNITKEVNTTSYNFDIYMGIDVNSCSAIVELWSADVYTEYPYTIEFSVILDKIVNDSVVKSLSPPSFNCMPRTLAMQRDAIGLEACRLKNIPVDCDSRYDVTIKSDFYDEKQSRCEASQVYGWGLCRIELTGSEDYTEYENEIYVNQTIEGQADAMESYATANFLWIIFQLSLVLIVLFLLTSISKMISGRT